jgi:hypothetical protein
MTVLSSMPPTREAPTDPTIVRDHDLQFETSFAMGLTPIEMNAVLTDLIVAVTEDMEATEAMAGIMSASDPILPLAVDAPSPLEEAVGVTVPRFGEAMTTRKPSRSNLALLVSSSADKVRIFAESKPSQTVVFSS